MKKGFKTCILFILIIFGFCYMLKNKELNLGNLTGTGIDVKLEDKDKLIDVNSKNLRPERLLVNIDHGISANYIPERLAEPNIPFSNKSDEEEKQVAGIIVKPLEELINAAKEDGIILLGNSGYRSYESQKSTYKGRVKSQGKKLADAYVAKPGFSEHQTGLCIDITNKEGYFAEGTKEAQWLAKNCYRFGFIIRYPKGKKSITNIEYEPWHIRYIGREVAKYVYYNEITLEEYLGK